MSNADRRGAMRVRLNLAARWEGALAQCEGDVVDLSATGCFVLTPDLLVRPDELLRIEIKLPEDDLWLNLWGEIVYQVPEMGFGIRFTYCSGEEEVALAHLIKAHANNPAA